MTSSVVTTPTSTSTALTVLYQMAQNQAALTQNQQLAEISQDLQNQLNRKISSLQTPVDQISVNVSQQQITSLQAQQKAVSGLETTFGTNGSLLSDLSSQVNLMSQAATAGNSSAFDNALSAATTDVSDLGVASYNPIFQYDGVSALKTNGLGIQSSASYDLSTAPGQAAATAAVTAAATVVGSILAINGSNQTIAASQLTALDGKISSLQNLQSLQQNSATQQTQAQIQQLTTNEQNQLHLIQLNLGNTSALATELNTILNPPSPVTSVFGALANSVGETAKTAETQLGQTPAILSLFA
jgi:hypothetical protein